MENERYEFYMREALKEAEKARVSGEVPVGCVIVKDDEIISRAHNSVETDKNALAHAEIKAMQAALETLKYRLFDCEMYVTLEPCSMCAGAAVHSRIKKIVIGTDDPKTGACGSVLDITANRCLNHHPEIVRGVLKEECSEILKAFFKEKRKEHSVKKD